MLIIKLFNNKYAQLNAGCKICFSHVKNQHHVSLHIYCFALNLDKLQNFYCFIAIKLIGYLHFYNYLLQCILLKEWLLIEQISFYTCHGFHSSVYLLDMILSPVYSLYFSFPNYFHLIFIILNRTIYWNSFNFDKSQKLDRILKFLQNLRCNCCHLIYLFLCHP